MLDIEVVREKLSSQIVTLLQPVVVNSTTLRVIWEVRRNQRYVQGYRIKYREVLSEELSSGRHTRHNIQSPSYTVETTQGTGITSHMLYHLAKYTWYDIRVQPFYRGVEGIDSNNVRARTSEDGLYNV